MSRRLVLLLSFAAGATAANLYDSQPLLERIAAELDVRAGPQTAGTIGVTGALVARSRPSQALPTVSDRVS